MGFLAGFFCKHLHDIPSIFSAQLASILFNATGENQYLNVLVENIRKEPDNVIFVVFLSRCNPNPEVYDDLANIYVNSNAGVRNIAVMGLLYNKGIIKNCLSVEEANQAIPLRCKFISEDKEERKRILKAFECGNL